MAEGKSASTNKVKERHKMLFRKAFQKGGNLNECDDFGYTPLMVAVRENYTTVIKCLLAKGAEVNQVNKETSETALTIASFCGLTEIVAILVEHGADTEVGDCTALMDAAVEGNLETVLYFLQKTEAAIDARSLLGYTPLSYACENGHTDVAAALLDYGANIENENMGGLTPLIIACNCGHKETVRMLLSRGANVDHTTKKDESCLYTAVILGHTDIVKELLKKGCDIDHQEMGGFSPLMCACGEGNLVIAKMLIAKGADVNRLSAQNQYNALSLACLKGQVEMVKYLLAKTTANPFFKLKDSTTMLMMTVKGGVIRGNADRNAVIIAQILLDYPGSIENYEEPMEAETSV